MSTEDSSFIPQKWKRRYTVIVAVVSAVVAAISFVANSQQVIKFVQDAVPYSVGRWLPGSRAARFDEGALAALQNQFVTDERLLYYFGQPSAETPIEDRKAVNYETPYGNVYIERKGSVTKSIAVSVGAGGKLVSTIERYLADFSLPADPTLKDIIELANEDAFSNVFSASSEFVVRASYPSVFAAYRYPEFVNCNGRDSVSSLLGWNTYEGLALKTCFSKTTSLKGHPFFAINIFESPRTGHMAPFFVYMAASQMSPSLWKR